MSTTIEIGVAWTTLPNQLPYAYAEVSIDAFSGGNNQFYIGLTPDNTTPPDEGYGIQFVPGGDSALIPGGTGPQLNAGDVIQFALDQAGGNLWIGQNGTWIGGGDPAAGSSPSLTGLSGAYYVAAQMSFSNAGAVTGAFTLAELSYAPPSGFSSWSGS